MCASGVVVMWLCGDTCSELRACVSASVLRACVFATDRPKYTLEVLALALGCLLIVRAPRGGVDVQSISTIFRRRAGQLVPTPNSFFFFCSFLILACVPEGTKVPGIEESSSKKAPRAVLFLSRSKLVAQTVPRRI